ncbi:hypothetical protein HC823_01940, partial [Candidatus Gracilibacteria bacterium]|nr:hypothetical protein [Candidatus Gracilibacteria bacterium]
MINPAMTPTGVPFPPQCFVIVPSLDNMANDTCSATGGGSGPSTCGWGSSVSPGLQMSQQLFLDDGRSEKNLGSFKPKNNLKSVNRQVLAADIIMIWLQFQIREFSNFKFPSFDFLVPKFPESSSNDAGNKSALQQLQDSPFVRIKRRKVSIPYPEFTDAQFDAFKLNVKTWKGQLAQWKEQNLQKVRVFKADLNVLVGQIDANLEMLQLYSAYLDPQVSAKLQVNLEKLKAQVLALSAQLAQIETVMDTAFELGVKIDQNLAALESYRTTIAQLKVLPFQLDKLFESVVQINALTGEYWGEWLSAKQKSAQKWKEFSAQIKGFFELLSSIPKIFGDFHANCNGCKISRGTLLPWLIKMMLGWLKLPVIPMPRFPDIVVDLTKVGIGMELAVPEISFEPIEFTLPPLPQLPVVVLPNLDTFSIPEIPPISKFVMESEFGLNPATGNPFTPEEFGSLSGNADLALQLDVNGNPIGNIPGLDQVELASFVTRFNFALDKALSIPQIPIPQLVASMPTFPPIPTFEFDFSLPPIQFPTLPV